MLKAELGKSLAVGTQQDTALNSLIAGTQKWLASEYDWPFLDDHWDSVPALGTRYHTVPDTAAIAGAAQAINFERPVTVQVKWGDVWQEVLEGITTDEYNTVDSDAGDRQDPIQRWRMAGQTKYEVWPLPTTAQTVRFFGQRALVAVTYNSADGTVVDLDDLLVVLFTAAKYLAKAGAPDAPVVLAAAQQRLARLRGAYPARTRDYIVGGARDGELTRIVPIIAIHG